MMKENEEEALERNNGLGDEQPRLGGIYPHRPAGRFCVRSPVRYRVPLLILFLFSYSFPGHARAERWWGPDAAAHFGVGAAFGISTYGFLWAVGYDRPEVRWLLSGLLATLPGVAKELYDAGQPGNHFSESDLCWTASGGVLGSGILWALEMLFTPRAMPRGSHAWIQLQPNSTALSWRGAF
jgi:uncharacterized protein YfiM (DUF2279 family)